MNNFHWTNIISLDSSQNNAFEELICQLAKKEPIENKKEFSKVGNPDGGIECYIILNNGEEIGFQAKWFLSSPQNPQFNQIEKSFKTALEKHPNLTKYYIAIPLDRADPRIDDQKWFMDKWNEKIEKWKQYAKENYNRDIEIVYWGSSELIGRLVKEENSGLKKFFFGEIDLSNEWFKNQNELAIKDLGARYTPEVNIELEIIKNFDALSRNKRFKELFDAYYHDMMVSYREFIHRNYTKDEKLKESIDAIEHSINEFEKEYFKIDFTSNNVINFKKLLEKIELIKDISEKVLGYLDDLNQKEIEEKKIKTEHGYRTSTTYDYSIGKIRDAYRSLDEFREILYKPIINIANNPYIILDGEAGIGKSHLLADIVDQRLKDGYDSVFLLGQHFMQEKSPWSQILDMLRLRCTEDEFLGALNAKAEMKQKRVIIFIDAINEGRGKSFWKDFLVSFIESIKKYELLGLVLSIRSSYKELIIPKTVKEDKSITFITHYGFEDVEYDATKLFFDYYQIEQPSVPLLHPEFSNPLFLKLFCEGLKKRGLSRIPDGYEGITNIIKFFIEGIEGNLLKKYSSIKKLNLLDEVLNVLTEEFLKNQILSYRKAYKKIESIASEYRIESGLLDDLISEGLLTLNMQYDYDIKKYYEVVYIAYERFEDHLKVKYLIDSYIDKNNPKDSFEKEPLKSFFDEENIWKNRGMIEAMSIQLPEFCDTELIDILPQNMILIEAFFESLIWRKTESISELTIKRIMKNINNKHVQKNIFEIFFLTASNPKHPLNAKLMHKYLRQFTMKDRDVWFIPLLNEIYLDYGVNPIKRLIDWTWSDGDKSYLSDESVFLTVLSMSWFLITSNRKLRDSATKAMIALLQGRIKVIIKLLQEFKDIEEPYIYERLFAIAFGVVVRTENNEHLKELGEYIYQTIFDKGEVYPHILLRDYAKNTIDYINFLGVTLDINYEKVKPPYKSNFPKIEELPTNEEIKKYEDRDKNYHNSEIISSMTTEYGHDIGSYGDFGRYVFGYKINEFVDRKYEQLVSNYATRKIFEEYGYEGEFFDKTEKSIQEKNRYNYDRYNHKIERIGKKYQWIAMHDTLARLTDNFKMKDPNRWGHEEKYIKYKGAFEPYVRDIDPTILLKATKGNWYADSKNDYWWSPKENIQWQMENKEWIDYLEDLPNIKNCIFFKDEKDIEWIALDSNPQWDEPLRKGIKRSDIVHKRVWYILNSYFIPSQNIEEFKQWAKKQNFWNDWMPKLKEHYQVFNREFYWSEAYKFFQQPYYGYEEWSEIDSYSSKGKYPHKIGLTTSEYYWECEFDYSKEGSLRMQKPSSILFDGMKMRYGKNEGYFIDTIKELICFDPSIYHETYPCLMIRKDKFIKFLFENKLTVCWTIIGEKQVITPSHNYDDNVGVMQMSGFITLDGKGTIKIKEANNEFRYYNKNLKIEEMK